MVRLKPGENAHYCTLRPLIERDSFLVVRLAHKLNDSVMLKRAVAASLNVDILSDATAFRLKTGVLWPNLVGHFAISLVYATF